MSETTLRLDRPLKMVTICLGQMQTNCYIVENTKTNQAFVFDPGDQGERIMNTLEEDGMELAGVCLTHGHFDHIIGVPEVKRAFHIPVYASETEDAMLADTSINLSCHVPGKQTSFHADVLVHDGDELELLGYKWKVIATPGHTAGSVSYYIPEEEVLLSGDTLFYESYGRTDLATGSSSDIADSLLNKLFVLPEDTMVYPGHGDPTTIGYEKEHNPIPYYR